MTRTMMIAAMAALTVSAPATAAVSNAGWWDSSNLAHKVNFRAGTPEVVRGFAACAIKASPTNTRELLMTPRGSQAEASAKGQLFKRVNRCLPEGEFDTDVFPVRAAIAEAIYWRDYARFDVTALRGKAATSGDREMSYGACVTAADPVAVRTLIATRPRSGEEAEAFNGLLNAMNSCVTKAVRLPLQPAAMRSLLAQSLYHAAARSGATASQR